jgi:uncharacterized DUF497 family protein
MRFSWIPEKNRANVRHHGIAFQDGSSRGRPWRGFDDPFDYGETRIYAIGLVNGIEVTVIDIDRESEHRHLISAWRSEPHERRAYWQKLEEEGG